MDPHRNPCRFSSRWALESPRAATWAFVVCWHAAVYRRRPRLSLGVALCTPPEAWAPTHSFSREGPAFGIGKAMAFTSAPASPRTHFSEKSAPTPKHGAGLSSPAFGFRMPEQKGWAGLEPETPKPLSDLKQKKRRPGVFSFKVVGNRPKRAGWRSRSASHSKFLADNFS